MDILLCNVLFLFTFSPFTYSAPSNELLSHEYLTKYGYLPKDGPHSGSLRTQESLSHAFRRFQKMAGLEETGELDAKTIEMMKRPRCGVSDDMGNSDRAKRYALHGSKWSKLDLTFKISTPSDKMPEAKVLAEIERAFEAWSQVTPLTFTKKESGPVDIDIRFAKSWHGDNNPFDGKGQTLAHAFFPQYGGDAHFDDDEPWTIDTSEGVNFFQVAVHEFGHSLGLAHSDIFTALMAPFYKGFQPDFQLGNDDVEAIQTLYGTPKSRKKTTTTPKPTPAPRIILDNHIPDNNIPRDRPTTKRPVVLDIPEICRSPRLDAITMTKDGSTYLFEGEKYYLLTKKGIATGYPREISRDWEGVPSNIDAALTWENGYTYLFKGYYYWKFENQQLIYGPKRIAVGFRGVPNNIDAAMVWGGNGKTYFFRGNKYWRYSGKRIDYGYPRHITKWRGLPSNIQASFKWENGRTYFFTGKEYYRYNDNLFSVDPTYPRQISTWWLGCPEQGEMTQIINPYPRNQHLEGDSTDEQWITIEDDQDPNRNKSVDFNHAANSFSLWIVYFVTLSSLFLSCL